MKLNAVVKKSRHSEWRKKKQKLQLLKKETVETEFVPKKKQPPRFWQEPTSHQHYFDWFAREMGIDTYSDWYQFSSSDVQQHKGRKVLTHYNHQLSLALQRVYKQFTWYPWLFDYLPDWFWNEEDNRRKYLDWTEEELGIFSNTEWYGITLKQFHGLPYFDKFFQHYDNSMTNMLQTLHSDYQWRLGFFERQHRQWDTNQSQRKYLDWIAEELHIFKQEDFYNIKMEEVERIGGWVDRWGSSLIRSIETVYPEFTWHTWPFSTCPKNFWDEEDNRKKYLDWLGDKLGVETLDDWYEVQVADAAENHGFSFLDYYGGSFIQSLQIFYPDHNWLPWKFKTSPRGYWMEPRNQRKFFDWMADQMGIETQSGWFPVRVEDVHKHGGGGMLIFHHSMSVYGALSKVYPEYSWKPWLFNVISRNFWNKPANVKSFLDWLSEQLQLNSLQDWLQLTGDQISQKGGSSLLKRLGGVNKVLAYRFPELRLKKEKQVVNAKVQQFLAKLLRNTFNTYIEVNYKHPQLHFPDTNEKLELDIFIPHLSLAFEYQGIHHYSFTKIFGESHEFEKKDSIKRELCEKGGITLIAVPYWWDYDIKSLLATIHVHRPDVFSFPVRGQPIPMHPPAKTRTTRRSQQAALSSSSP